MNSALIKRLRKIATLEAEDYGAEPQDHSSWQAADLIERQAAQIEMLRKALENIKWHREPGGSPSKYAYEVEIMADKALEQFATLKGLK